MNLVRHLRQQAEDRPDAPALVEQRRGRRRACTFADLEARSSRLAALLQDRGLAPGATLLVAQPLSIELYVVLAAAFRAGLVAMVPHASARRDRLAEGCRIRPPEAFVGPPKAHLLRLLVPEVRHIPHRLVTGRWPVPGATRWERAARGLAPAPVEPRAADAPALLTFTSGSTGTPKAVVRAHGLLTSQYEALRACLDLRPGQVDLSTLPVFVLANLAAGVTSVLPDADLRRPGAIDPGPVLAQIRAEQPTRTSASPALLERLLDAPDAAALSGFERIDTGGAPVFPGLLERLHEAAPRSRLVAVYGSTEAEPIAHVAHADVRPEDWAAMRAGRGLLAGPPVAAVRLRILPDRWGTPIGPFTQAALEAEAVPAEAPGEIVVGGAHVLPGYLDGRGDAETKFEVDGVRWHRTGDAGYLDADGRLWLLGRCSARIDDARGRLYPLGPEAAAQARPGIRRAAVAALDGQRLLVVEPADGATVDAGALRGALGPAGIDAVRVVEALPVDRRHNAKIDYPALQRLLER